MHKLKKLKLLTTIYSSPINARQPSIILQNRELLPEPPIIHKQQINEPTKRKANNERYSLNILYKHGHK